MKINDDHNDIEEKLSKIKKDLVESLHKKREKLIFENNKFTPWFKELIIEEELLGGFENSLPEFTDRLYNRSIRDCIQYDCKEDIQYLYVDYIAPISPDDVEFDEWKNIRKERLAKWGTYHSLNRVYIDFNNNKILNITDLPVVEREYDLEKGPNKFTVGNGNHRFGYAKSKNIPTVMCLVHDIYIIRKSWVEGIIDKLRKEKEEDSKENEGMTFL